MPPMPRAVAEKRLMPLLFFGLGLSNSEGNRINLAWALLAQAVVVVGEFHQGDRVRGLFLENLILDPALSAQRFLLA